MRKALKAATLMGLAAALIVPVSPSAKAGDMSMGDTKVSIGGQLRERLEWNASLPGTGDGTDIYVGYRARIKIKAELTDGVTVVFVPQATGHWGEGGQGLYPADMYARRIYPLGWEENDVNMHEAYMLLSNPFGVSNVFVKVGRQEVNLGNQRLVGAVNWTMSGRSFDGILVGYSAGDYGLAAVFYGQLFDNLNNSPTLVDWSGADLRGLDLYIATWQGKLKPFGIGGTYEITDIYVNDATNGLFSDINTIYGRFTPVFNTDFANLKFNAEAAIQSGEANNGGDFEGYFYSVGAGATFTNVAWKPSVSVNYDFYSGDDDPTDNDVEAFWSVLPTAHKWLGHADVVWVTNIYNFNTAVARQTPGVTDLYAVVTLKPTSKLGIYFAPHYFKTDEDYTTPSGSTSDDVGWETDLEATYKYSKNLCFKAGWYHFDPDDDFGNTYLGGDDAGDHFYLQADVKF